MDVNLIKALKSHVLPVGLLSKTCSSMETVPLKMFDDHVTLVLFEILRNPSVIRAVYRFAGKRFEIAQYFGDSVQSDPWMGEGMQKRALLLKWIVESIMVDPRPRSNSHLEIPPI